MVTQALELSNQPHVVVATPGRLADHIRSSNTFNMSKIQFLVSSARTKREEKSIKLFSSQLYILTWTRII